MSRSSRLPRARGFTLVEVMIALAILGVALIVVVKSVAQNLKSSVEAEMMGVTTELARGKMYEIEEKLLTDGYQDGEQTEHGDFAEQGWPTVTWESHVIPVELPSFDNIAKMAKNGAKGAPLDGAGGPGSGALLGSGADAGGGTSFGDSALGGMMSMFGGGLGGAKGGSGADDAMGGAFLQSQFQMVGDILKSSMRKVSLTLTWQVVGSDREITVVCYFTDAGGMTKVLGNLGAGGAVDGEGSGSGAGSGKSTGQTKTPTGKAGH